MRAATKQAGRRCAWCGRLGGAGFTSLVELLTAAGVTFRHRNRSRMQFLHPPCAARAQKAARRIADAATLAGQVTA